MKFEIMLGILFTLLERRRTTAPELAAKYGVSTRTVYRYVDEMTIAGVPLDIARGPRGGIYISDAFKLPKGLLTKAEYRKTIDAMLAMNEQTGDADLAAAIGKLSAQVKREKQDLTISGNILVDSGTWGDSRKFSEKLALVERASESCKALDVDYVSREGIHSHRRIYPHLLVYKQNIWYVYAYCTERDAFRLFKLGRMRSIVETGITFEKLPFNREDIPLNFWHDSNEAVEAVFGISPEALPFAEEWLGIENIRTKDGKHYSEVKLPNDEALIGKILSAGTGFKVISPRFLAEKVQREAELIAKNYGAN